MANFGGVIVKLVDTRSQWVLTAMSEKSKIWLITLLTVATVAYWWLLPSKHPGLSVASPAPASLSTNATSERGESLPVRPDHASERARGALPLASGERPNDIAGTSPSSQGAPGAHRAKRPIGHQEGAQLEALASQLGHYIAQLQAGQTQEAPPSSAYQMWPDIASLLAMYTRNMRAQAKGEAEELPSDEAESLIYQYLFEAQAQHTLEMLGRSLCLARLDRVWPQLRANPLHTAMPRDGCCPVSGEPYWVKPAYNRCCVHQTLDRLWPGSKKLSLLSTCHKTSPAALVCSGHALRMSFPRRSVWEPQPELYSQLSMGYFNSRRAHLLDTVIVDNPVSAAKPGETVVDVGCGAGCYVWSMARAVGKTGRVFAQDVEHSVLDFVDFVARKRGCAQVKTVLASRESPHIAVSSVDRIFIIDVYNVIVGVELDVKGKMSEGSRRYMTSLLQGLKPSGHLVIVDFTPEKNRPHVPEATTVEHMRGFGLRLLQRDLVQVGPHSHMYALTFGRAK